MSRESNVQELLAKGKLPCREVSLVQAQLSEDIPQYSAIMKLLGNKSYDYEWIPKHPGVEEPSEYLNLLYHGRKYRVHESMIIFVTRKI